MIYTVAIGDTLVNGLTNLSRVETLDESLDYASIILNKELSLTTKQMKEVVTITVNDNSEIRSYYFLIDSDISTPIDKDDLTFSRHEISLIELTSRLSDYTVGYRQFTNQDDDLYDVLSDLTQTVFFRNSFIGDSTRRIDVDLTHSSLDRLKDVQSRDFQFDNHTYFEACVAIMNEVGGFPRVIYENGIYKLTLDLKNERNTLRNLLASSENNYKQTHNITKYGTTMESYTDNQVFDNTLAGASTVEPSANGFMPVRTVSEVFNSDSSVIITRYDIRQIVKAELFFDNVDATTLTFDLTPRVVNESVYNGLEVGDVTLVDLGNTTDGNLPKQVAPAPTLIDGRLQVQQKIGTLFYKDNIIQNFFTFFGNTVWTEPNWDYIVNSVYFEEYGNGVGTSAKLKFNSDMYDFENIRMRITYIPIFDGVLHAEKYSVDDVDKFTMIQSNQSASAISTEKALKSLGAEINALGNKEIMTTSRITLLADEFNIGDFTSDGFILTNKEVIYNKDEMIVRYEWDKDYQKRNEDIAVDSAIRFYAIPQGGVSNRKLYYKEYVYVGFDGLTSESTLLNTRGREIFTNVFGKEAQYNTSIQNGFITNEEVLTTTNPILLPVISTGGRNALNFNFGFQSPIVAGERLDLTSQTIPLLEPINYTADDGELEFINFELVDTVDVTDPTTLPLTPYTDRDNTLVGSIFNQYLVKKDSAEIIDISYQVHMIPNTNIVIGDYLSTRNNLIENKTAFDDLVVYSSDTYYSPQETAKVKGSIATGVTVSKLSNEIIKISSNVNNTAWAIATTNGELVIAVNQFDALQDEINFKYFNSRNDIDYSFIGDVIFELPDSPSDLTVTTINAGTLDLEWVDNSTDETNFLIYISDNGTNYNLLDTVGANVTTYTSDGLMAGTTYYYRVFASNQAGVSVNFASNFGTTDAEPNPPLPVTNYIVTAQDSDKLNATWTGSAGATNYVLEIKKNVDTIWTVVEILAAFENYQWSGLDASTLYDTRIKAKNSEGSSGYKNYSVFTGSGVSQTARPTILNVVAGETTVDFDVRNNDGSTATVYVDYNDSTPDRQSDTVSSGGTQSFQFTGLQADTSYTLYAKAQASGETLSSADSEGFTTDPLSTPPSAPTTFTGSFASGGIQMNWNNVANETGYTIELHYNSSFTNLAVSIDKAANTTSHLESPLITGTYWARIRAYNGVGNSAWKENTDNGIVVS
ncbi:fibronectin-like protein [PinkBerry-associated phage LS06-2018-MD08]|nr:fibronectin-like protein [PinkBerry-associated phage LS06-2018-MD08]